MLVYNLELSVNLSLSFSFTDHRELLMKVQVWIKVAGVEFGNIKS